MKNIIWLLFAFFSTKLLKGQELFLMTDPASNLPAKVFTFNLIQSFSKEAATSRYMYKLMPELSYGITKKWMVRGSAFLSNAENKFNVNGAGIMTKYRFLSKDDLNSHFRMSVFARYSYNNMPILQEQIEILGNNTGFEGGVIATKLIHKLAISSTVSYEHALNNSAHHSFPSNFGGNVMNYSLSLGQLISPKIYTSYKQTNINFLLEFIGQTVSQNGKSYVDIVPALQFILASKARIDVAYKQQLISSMSRFAANGVYLNLYYTFF